MIEVGEYVRTNYGLIEKIKTINKFGIVTNHDNKEDTISGDINYYTENGLEINAEEIMKRSKDIIHLIEAGDYVNGNKVVQTYKDSKKQDEIYLEVVVSSIMIKEPLTDYIEENRIKTILTKEQYERNCYKVEE